MRARASLLLALAALLPAPLAGRQEPAPPEPPAYVRDGVVPAGWALLYLYNRSGATLIATNVEFHVDDEKVASIPRSTWTAVLLQPGEHRLAANASFDERRFVIMSGTASHWYYRFSPGRSWAWPFAGNPNKLDIMPDSLARAFRAEHPFVPPITPLPDWSPEPEPVAAAMLPP